MPKDHDCWKPNGDNCDDTVRAQALTELLLMVLPPMLAAHPRVEVLRNDLRLHLARFRSTDTARAAYQAQVLQGLLQASGDLLA